MDPSDPRLVRDGLSLREWLPRLLDPVRATRRAAENAVSAIFWGAPVADITVWEHAPKDQPAHRADVGRAIAAILLDPTFDGPAFVRAALDQMREDRRRQDAFFALEDRYFNDDDAGEPTEAEEAELLERIGATSRAENEGQLANSAGALTIHEVLEHAGRILLTMPDEVRAAMQDDACQQPMAAALGRLGPAAAEFAPALFAYTPERSLLYSREIAAVGAEDRRTVLILRDQLRSAPDGDAFGAAQALDRMGAAAVATVPTLVDDLLLHYEGSDRGNILLFCLPALAPTRRDVFDLVARAARPGSPDMRRIEGHAGFYDAALYRRGPALTGLGHFKAFAEEAVPILLDALETFTEYDPDWGYSLGEHGRVIDALERLSKSIGPATVDAIARALTAHFYEHNGESVDWRVIGFLGDLGPPAAAALPALRALDAELKARHPEWAAPSGDPPERTGDTVRWAIWRLSSAES